MKDSEMFSAFKFLAPDLIFPSKVLILPNRVVSGTAGSR